MTNQRAFNLHNGRRGAAITVRVIPRASRNEIAGVQPDGTIKIRLTAAPVEGQANKALIEYLAEVLNVAKSKIEIVAGLSGRDKLITILDLDSDTVQEKILSQVK
jgi:uncharacterized protein (TIGR00251 family)